MADGQLPDLPPEALDRLPPEGLLGRLASLKREVTRDLIDIHVARQAEVATLRRAIADDDSTWDPETSDGVWWGIVHAVFVLGQMQGAKAVAGLVGAPRRLGHATADVPWDRLESYGPAQFRGKPERAALRALTLDPAANQQARSVACDCLPADAQEQGGGAPESTPRPARRPGHRPGRAPGSAARRIRTASDGVGVQ